jgi:hypothetical protein
VVQHLHVSQHLVTLIRHLATGEHAYRYLSHTYTPVAYHYDICKAINNILLAVILVSIILF